MKYFEIKSQSGMIFRIGVNEEPKIKEYTDNSYIKELEIVFLSIDGMEVPKNNRSGKPFFCEFRYTPHQGERKLIIRVQYDAYKFIKNLKNLKNEYEGIDILCSSELTDYYSNVYLPAAEAIIARLKAEKYAVIQAAFDNIQDSDILEIGYNTSSGYNIRSEAGKHELFKTGFSEMKKAKVSIPDSFITSSDWGDYSLSYDYKIPLSELKRLYQTARDILEPQEREVAEKKAAQEAKEAALKSAVKCEIIKQGKTQVERLDPFALVRMTNSQTGETLEFSCRNVFDFGYVVNPNYAIADGLEPGGLASGDKWMDLKKGEGWVEVRDQTEFEKLCLEYLHTFPPINSGIRM